MRLYSTLIFYIIGLQCAFAIDYYVSTSGNDATGNGSQANPWRTLKFACSKVAANQGHTIILSAGTFVELQLTVPTGVSVLGAGIGQTIIKANPSFYYNPASPGFGTDKFLINFSSAAPTNGNQSIKDLTIDGDGKKLHGGIYVRNRNNLLIEGIRVQFTNFTGIWLWDMKDSRLTNVQFKDCAWGSSGWSAATLLLANLERVEIDHIDVNEGFGEGVKSLGANGTPTGKLHYVKFHDNRISVTPVGQWNGGAAPNIAIELWNIELLGFEMYNNYIDNTVSLVNDQPQFTNPKGLITIHVYNNFFDMETRGGGYSMETSLHDIEVDHNYFLRGAHGIVNWSTHGINMSNWLIHHNVFYGIESNYPAAIVRAKKDGFHNVKFYNNTVELAGSRTTNVFTMMDGVSNNVEIKNNLIIDSNTSYSYYPNKLVYIEKGTLTGLQVTNNLLLKIPAGTVPGTYANNLTVDPKINKTGARPTPYYLPTAGSPLIDAGVNVGFPFDGNAPDIGAYEFSSGAPPPTNNLPQVSITSPANNSTYVAGSSVTINANATDSDGSISRVEFFSGTTKLGEDLTGPYSFVWNNIPAGNYTITAKATDNKSGITTSAAISITVNNPNTAPVVNLTGPANNSLFTTGSTVTISATASDAGGTVTKVEFFNGTTKLGEDLTGPYTFAWNNMPNGSYTISVKATDNQNATATSGTITITVSAGNNPPVVSITSPANNATFVAPASVAITANASDTNGSITKVEFFNGTAKIGEDLTSPYSFTWTNVAAGTYSLTAKATDNQGAIATSAAISITVDVPSVPPTVVLTGPANNASFTVGTTITLTANASQPAGSITKVEFFNGTTKLGEDLTAPYSFAWTNASVGTHSLGARATDDQNKVGNSALIQITVLNANTLPVVNLTSPANNALFLAPASITITANASDADGSITKVEFYNGTIKLGEDLTSPYSFVWNNVPDGNYALSAKAIDNKNAVTTSGIVNIVVNVSPTPPVVNITSPANNATFVANSDITITATASTPTGTISKVEFFNGSIKLGQDLTSPYTFVWNNVPAGSYSLTAKATNSQNAVTTSPVVSILVSAPSTPPVVNITSPANNSVFTAGSNISITATATDANGTVTRVEFFSGTTKLGEDLTSPYSFQWNNVPEGTFLITAKATDNQGVTATDEIQVFVEPPNILPQANAGDDVTTQLPVNDLVIDGTGTDADGVISTYSWAQVSGPDAASFTQDTFGQLHLNNLIEGTYVFELTVTDNGGMTGTDQVTITVTPTLLSLAQIPRYFSPNSDGIKDVWEWPRIELYENSQLTIYNRFGQKVYEAAPYQNDWNGTMDGKPLQEDAYYYVIKLSNTDLKGAVRIVR